jgi:hypothetical protein
LTQFEILLAFLRITVGVCDGVVWVTLILKS